MTHYHVGSNTPGYLPEADVYTVSTKRDAMNALAYDVKRYIESEWDLPRGQRRTGKGSVKSGDVYFDRPGDAHDLGLHFWWTQCAETDCELSDDD